jgi:hypothetical protein
MALWPTSIGSGGGAVMLLSRVSYDDVSSAWDCHVGPTILRQHLCHARVHRLTGRRQAGPWRPPATNSYLYPWNASRARMKRCSLTVSLSDLPRRQYGLMRMEGSADGSAIPLECGVCVDGRNASHEHSSPQ